MFITNHALAGTLIGINNKSSKAAFTEGFLSHLVMDYIPHWGGEVSPEEFKKVAVADGLIGLTVCAGALMYSYHAGGSEKTIPVAAGILGACLPDTNKPWKFFLGKENFFPEKIEKAFSVIQTESREGYKVEAAAAVVLTAAIGYSIWRKNRRKNVKK